MKVFFLSLVFILCSTEIYSESYAYADCTAGQHIDTQPIDDFGAEFIQKFPFSILAFSMDLLDQLSSIEPQSPSDYTMHIVGVDITPLSWIDSDFTDFVVAGMRIMILALFIFSTAKHVIERIL